jgi:hypothetical protein
MLQNSRLFSMRFTSQWPRVVSSTEIFFTGTDKVVTLLFLAADTIPKTVKVLRTAMAV